MRVRTGYSFKTAYGHLRDVKARLLELGWERLPISDRNSTFAFNRWSKMTEGKAAFGVELAVTQRYYEKQGATDWWTFFATDSLADLHALISKATEAPDKDPVLRYADALAAKGVIKIAGEWANLDLIPVKSKDLYIALSPGMPQHLYREALKRGYKFIATSENYYPKKEDQETYRVALGKRSATQTYPLYILTDDEWRKFVWFADDKVKDAAIKNRNAVMLRCNAKITKASLVKPEKKITLRAMCEAGAKRLGVDLNDEVYKARLDKELNLIASKNFEDYFYIIADIIDFAKDRMLVGPARGSSCGSLVCYLIGITTIDPIPYDLIFERFIDVNRNDLPDIDIDFSDAFRQEVFDYVERKYGKARTARLGTVGTFQPRSALTAAGTALAIPKFRVEKLIESLIVRSSGDARALQTLGDTLTETHTGREFIKDYPEVKVATPLEGHPTTASQHAAGVIITEEAINKFVAIDERSKAAMCDKKDAEDLGMLKIDMLGLTQLSIFERTLVLAGLATEEGITNEFGNEVRRVRMKDGKRIVDFFNAIPLDDAKAFEILNQRRYSGIFQFNGRAPQSLANSVTTDHIEDFISMVALARPGPMVSGGANAWVARKLGHDPVTYPHPLFEPTMRNTLGVVMYQEQVMQIGRDVGDLSWDDVTQLRKAMSKSLGKEYFDRFGDRWKANAIKKGVPEDTATKVWDDLCAYGSWAFNRSHSVAYGIVAYWSCYLKAYWPAEFAAANLDAEKDPNKQLIMLRELKAEGFSYKPIDLDHSEDRWTIKDGVLIGPLTQIKGIGPATVIEIRNARAEGRALKPGVVKRLARPVTAIDSLYPIADAVERLYPEGLESINIITKPTAISTVEPDGTNQTVLVIGIAERVVPRDENEAIKVAQRGGVVKTGQTASLNLFVRDDSGEVLCKIGYRNYDELDGAKLQENTRAGKTIYAIKGNVPKDFRMIWVNRIKYLGELDKLPIEAENETLQEGTQKQKRSASSTDQAELPLAGGAGKRKAPATKPKAKPSAKRKDVADKVSRARLQPRKGVARKGAKGKARAQTSKKGKAK
jgi:DNA polymerase III alpha subunit